MSVEGLLSFLSFVVTVISTFVGVSVLTFEPGTELCLYSPIKNVRFHVEGVDQFSGVHVLTVQSYADETFNQAYHMTTGQEIHVKFARHEQLRSVYTATPIPDQDGKEPPKIWRVFWYKRCV